MDCSLLPKKLRAQLEDITNGTLVLADRVEQLPTDKGSYLLIAPIAEPLELKITTLPTSYLKAGFYIYCGSARGPGGLKARLRRHFATDKKMHWHIDRLSVRAEPLMAIPVVDGNECELRCQLTRTGLFSVPVKGFGASDCSLCDSHLVLWMEDQS